MFSDGAVKSQYVFALGSTARTYWYGCWQVLSKRTRRQSEETPNQAGIEMKQSVDETT
jgi:hypothetical protein